jgi:hypothetical protein
MKSETRTVVVLNTRCGNGYKEPERLQLLFNKHWPQAVSFLGINRLNDDHNLLANTNVISWGGDGTGCKVAEYARKANNSGWCMLLDAGTLGDTSKYTGLGRYRSEPPEHYIQRMADYFRGDQMTVREFVPGVVINGGTENFLWTAGTGVAEKMLRRVEEARSWNLLKFGRLIYGLSGIINDLEATGNMEVELSNDEQPIKAVDVNLVHNFNRFGSMTLPHTGDNQLWIIPSPTKKGDGLKIAFRLAIDALRMRMKLNPTTGAVQISKLDEGQQINVRGNIKTIQVDSEIRAADADGITILTSPSESINPYRLLVKKS